jgi:hypothetical protein
MNFLRVEPVYWNHLFQETALMTRWSASNGGLANTYRGCNMRAVRAAQRAYWRR